MTWENVLKADFSFRDVIKNSRGVYAGIFDRIQVTPDLSKLGGAVLGDAIRTLENIEGMTVTDKRKAAEIVLMEPMLLGIDMMNDPSMDKDIDTFIENRVTSITQDEKDGEEESSPELTASVDKIANKAANKVVNEMKQTIEKTLENKLGEELIGAEKQEVMKGLIDVVSSQEFVGYVAVLLSSLIIKVAKESKEKAKESDNEVEVDDRGYSEDWMNANRSESPFAHSWEDILSRK